MTSEAFTRWLAEMKSAGLAKSDAEAGRLIGVSAHSIVAMKREGVNGHAAERTALACRAVLHRLEPYS